MSAVSRTVDIPPPRRGRRELIEDTGVRLGLHIKSAEQAMMAAKTEALRSFGLTVAQYAAMLSLYYVPEQSSARRLGPRHLDRHRQEVEPGDHLLGQ